MIALMGKIRRITELEFNDEKKTKLTVEYEIERSEGSSDIKLGEFFFEPSETKGLKEGADVTVSVRPYPKGKDIAFSALKVLPPLGAPKIA